jgi:hypothetical protein
MDFWPHLLLAHRINFDAGEGFYVIILLFAKKNNLTHPKRPQCHMGKGIVGREDRIRYPQCIVPHGHMFHLGWLINEGIFQKKIIASNQFGGCHWPRAPYSVEGNLPCIVDCYTQNACHLGNNDVPKSQLMG